MTREAKAIGAVACLVFHIAPSIVGIATLEAAIGLDQAHYAPQGVEEVVLRPLSYMIERQ